MPDVNKTALGVDNYIFLHEILILRLVLHPAGTLKQPGKKGITNQYIDTLHGRPLRHDNVLTW